MPWAIPVSCFVVLGITAAILRSRFGRRRNLRPLEIRITPEIRSKQFDGWVALQLQATNQSDVTIWLEDAEFLIGDLDANFQTALPSHRKIFSIKQAIHAGELLSLSIASTLYEAAGSPQGNYSFDFVGNIRYRIGTSWQEIRTGNYWIEMAALSVLKFKRRRSTNFDDSASSTRAVKELMLTSDGSPRGTERRP